MTSLSRELVFLILQFLDEEKFKESVHKLEKESGFFFNMKYFEEKVQAGEWEEVEKYLSGFTKVDDNRYSMKIFFEIRKQKYLEALDRQDKPKAVEILVGDLKVFSTFNEELYKEITQLLILNNFRENEQLSKYGDTKTARSIMLIELKKLIEANPLFRDKLAFPTLKSSRLRTLINQSLNWQHQLCKNPRPNPDIKTLFTDHTCSPSNGPLAPTPANLPISAVAKPVAYTSLGVHGPFPPAVATANANALAGWMANASASSSVQAAVVTTSTIPVPQNQVSILKRPRTPPATPGIVDYQNADHDQLMKRLRPGHSVEEVSYPVARQASWSLDDLPRTVAMTLHQGSSVISMDFHPSHHTLLLVGSNNGEITLWELSLRERLVSKPFKIWDVSACSLPFQAAAVKDVPISVSRVAWSPDGNFVGVAFTKHLIHLYAYTGSNELAQRIEVDAHVGGVNDLSFALPNKQLCIVTCGDDKLIKVWDANGRRLFTFEGHEAPVYSICPHHKENIQFIFSTAIDGKIKAWLYDNMGSRVDYDAPGHWCTTMLYSADGSRLFSCGTSKDGESFLVEWNESEGAIKRTYNGFRSLSEGEREEVGGVDISLGLDQFLGRYTSEDNQSFSKILERVNRKRKERFGYLNDSVNANANAIEDEKRDRITDGYGTSYQPPSTLEGWNYTAKNLLMYHPADRGEVPLTEEERAVRIKASTKEIDRPNTRFHGKMMDSRPKDDGTVEVLYTPVAGATPVPMSFRDAEKLKKYDLEDLRKTPNPFYLESGKKAENGYSYVKTPSPAPGVDDSPFITWGEIEGTPLRLDMEDTPIDIGGSADGPHYRIPSAPARDEKAHSLSREAARNLRERSKMFRKPPLASPARGGSASPSMRTLSPAAQKFVRNAIAKSSSTVDETLRASYRGSTPALATPTRVRSVSRLGRDESTVSRSPSVREGSNPPW